MKRSLPPLNGVRAFEAAARHLSFTEAARELGVTQAAISHQVRGLEERLGLKLFVRRNRALLLSDQGQAYLPAVRQAFDSLHEATERLLQRDARGPVTVSTTASFATKWLVPRLAMFQRAHPDIEVRISTSTELVDFSRDDVDLGIRYGGGKWDALHADRLLVESLFPVCSPALLKGPKPLRKPADLKNHTLLRVLQQRDDWQVWLTGAGVKGVDPEKAIEFDLGLTAIQAAIDGLGVMLGHDPLVENDLRAGRLVAPFDVQIPSVFAYYVVMPPESLRRKKIRALRDWLLSVARDAS
jgi:LysR family glycine cleavage system transcriptional activator